MIYHVMPGDAVAADFKKTNIGGELIVCREALIAGDVNADILPDFWDQRARFVLAEYGEDEIEYHDRVADELAKLLDVEEDSEVNLWFEYELFCSVNMWFCLWLPNETSAEVYRVEPIVRSEAERWLGFGKLGADDLQICFDARTPFTVEDIALGSALWDAYRKSDNARLADLGKTPSICFPYLNEVVEAAFEKDTRPAEIVAEIQFEGMTDFMDVFSEFTKRAGVYGLGDLQVERLLREN
ncbi:hypothetical protein BH10ACI3_BH10ACI3_20070 [soil metagenome]